jgi:universal stress protein E
MATRLKRILVAVRDPARPSKPLLRKVAALAKGSGASLELFHAINEPIAVEALRGRKPKHTSTEAMNAITTRIMHQLDKQAQIAAAEGGVRVQTHAEWDFPPHEAVIRRAAAMRADLVVAVPQPHQTGGRLLLANTDWELIRHCPAPLLLIKTTHVYDRPAVVVSVDPFHQNAKPAALDAQLLRAGADWAERFGGELHAFHAYRPLFVSAAATLGAAPVPAWLPPDAEATNSQLVQTELARLAQRANIPPARAHLRLGDVPTELAATVKKTRASLVVMGAVSRSALKRIFIGSTAEKTLDHVPCDVLIIKPKGFKSAVPLRMPLSLRSA